MQNEASRILIGESFIGEGAEAAHVNTVLGHRDGPVGVAWATALATPRAGHTPFVAVVRPSLPVNPMTPFLNKPSLATAPPAVLTSAPSHHPPPPGRARTPPPRGAAGAGRRPPRGSAPAGTRGRAAISTPPWSGSRPTRGAPGTARATPWTASARSRTCSSAGTPAGSSITSG